MTYDPPLRGKLGALWTRESPRGTFWSGILEIDGRKMNIVVFPNRYKEKDNQPDFEILLSKQPAPPAGSVVPPVAEIDLSNIPF